MVKQAFSRHDYNVIRGRIMTIDFRQYRRAGINLAQLACRVATFIHVRLRQGYGATVFASPLAASEDWIVAAPPTLCFRAGRGAGWLI